MLLLLQIQQNRMPHQNCQLKNKLNLLKTRMKILKLRKLPCSNIPWIRVKPIACSQRRRSNSRKLTISSRRTSLQCRRAPSIRCHKLTWKNSKRSMIRYKSAKLQNVTLCRQLELKTLKLELMQDLLLKSQRPPLHKFSPKSRWQDLNHQLNQLDTDNLFNKWRRTRLPIKFITKASKWMATRKSLSRGRFPRKNSSVRIRPTAWRWSRSIVPRSRSLKRLKRPSKTKSKSSNKRTLCSSRRSKTW